MKTVLGLLLLLTLTACTNHKSAVKDFYAAVYSGDGDMLKNVVIDEQLSVVPYVIELAKKGKYTGCSVVAIEENEKADLSQWQKELPNAKDIKEFVVATSCKDEKSAEAKSGRETVWAMKINGKYKIAVKK